MSKTPKLRFKEFSGDWELATLGDSAYIKGRIGWKNLKQEEYTEEGPYLIAGKHISNGIIDWNKCDHISMERYDESPEIALKNNDIIFSKDGSLGNPAIIENLMSEATINGTMMLVRLDNTFIYPKYFYYILNSIYFEKLISELKSGSSIPHIFQRDIVSFKFPITEIKEQEKIASFFSLIDSKISLQREKVEALKDYKRGMMQKIFSRELRFKDDEGRDYPEWEEKKLGEIANITMGQSPSSACYNEEYIGLPLIQGNADVKDRKTEPRVYTSEITKTCDIGDIIMSVRAPVGAISMSLHNACIGRGVCSIKPRYNVEYVYQFLLKYESKWSQVSQGSTFESVNSNDIKSLKILFPNLDEQNKIGNFLKNIDKRIEKEQEKLDSLNEYKKGLLQQMFV